LPVTTQVEVVIAVNIVHDHRLAPTPSAVYGCAAMVKEIPSQRRPERPGLSVRRMFPVFR
jgi:hypothetical protein